MSVDQPVSLPKRRRFVRGANLALIASLAINALFVGSLVAAFVRHGSARFGPPGAGAQNNLGAYVATLPTERGKAIWRLASDARRAVGLHRRDIRQARDEVLAVLTSEPFDKARFLTAQTHLIEVEHAQRVAQRDMLAAVAGSMTQEELRGYVRWRSPPRAQARDPDEQVPVKQ